MAYARKQTSSNLMNKLFLGSDCVLTTAFETIEGRWTTNVLICISMDVNRFGLIKQKLNGISDHVLGQRLNHLIDHGLISKKVVGNGRVYSLKPQGLKLIRILEQLAEWQLKRS